MLSTKYRLKLEFICSRIAQGLPVELPEMKWAQALASANTTAQAMLKQARVLSENPWLAEEEHKDSLDRFLFDLGFKKQGSDDRGLRNLGSAEETAEFFSRADRPEDWRQRD